MENEVELSLFTVLRNNGCLALLENFRTKFDRSRLVVAVHIAEGCSKGKTTDRMERLVNRKHVFGRGIKLLLGGVFGTCGTIFFTTDNAGFDFENDFVLGANLEILLRDRHVPGQREIRRVEHVVLKQVVLALGSACSGSLDQWLEEALSRGRLTVIGIESHDHIVLLSKAMGSLGKNDRSKRGILVIQAGYELSCSSRELDDSVRITVSECLQGRTHCDKT